MTEPDPPPPAGVPMLRAVPGPVERRQYYLVVACADGYDHELLVSEILGLYTGRTRRAYSSVCGLVVLPETSSTRAGFRCLDCRRIRATLTPEPVWWGDPRPLLQVLADFFARYHQGSRPPEGVSG